MLSPWLYNGKQVDNLPEDCEAIVYLITNKQKSIIVQKDISKVTYSITGGKLLTLLKEQNDIKKNRPILNISIKYRIYPVGIKIEEDEFISETLVTHKVSGLKKVVKLNQKLIR